MDARILAVGLIGREQIVVDNEDAAGWGGAATYFAASCCAAGTPATALAAMTAHDERDLRHVLAGLQSGVDLDAVHASLATSFELRYDDGELVDFSYEPGSAGEDELTIERLRVRLEELLGSSKYSHVHVCPLPANTLAAVAPTLRSSGVPLSVQAHFSEVKSSRTLLRELMSAASLVFMNEEEARMILDLSPSADPYDELSKSFSTTVVVTKRAGISILESSSWSFFNATSSSAVDPTGAGDTVAGSMIGMLGHDNRLFPNASLAFASCTVSSLSSHGVLQLSQTGSPGHG